MEIESFRIFAKKFKKCIKSIAISKNILYNIKHGDDNNVDTPVPIPNTEVKHIDAENTCELPCWEDKKSPN